MIGRPEKPRWQSSVLSVGTAIQTALIAAGFALIIWRRFVWRQLNPTFGFAVLFLIFIVLAVAFYALWMGVFFEHPAEIAKKLPIGSSELRRKKKEFFDNLPK
jgi:preprotein translocase subunit SecY